MWHFAKDFKSDVRLDGKTAVITGGNSGIGKETVKDLYKRGARVVILSRDQIKSTQVIEEIKKEVKQVDEKHDIRSKSLDLADLSSVRKCAQEILQEENQINFLINNAGLIGQKLSKDGFEMNFAVNYLGHFLFTLLLLPHIIASDTARIINVASAIHKSYYSRRLNMSKVRNARYWIFQIEAYSQSKCAQVLFNHELARRLKDAGIHNVTTYSLHPGIVATDIFETFDSFLWGLAWLWGVICYFFFLTPEQGSKTTLYCALDTNLAHQSGLYYTNCAEDTPNGLVKNQEFVKNVWKKSIEYTDLNNYDPFKSKKQ